MNAGAVAAWLSSRGGSLLRSVDSLAEGIVAALKIFFINCVIEQADYHYCHHLSADPN